jgi:ubiquinone/menaquinone biosynthesis C-methylase UbiE
LRRSWYPRDANTGMNPGGDCYFDRFNLRKGVLLLQRYNLRKANNMIQSLLRIFFRLLYHQFAWSYDLVASAVSLGRWEKWVNCALPYLEGLVLEIGPGPGHLQEAMLKRGLSVSGLDESRQMCRQAAHRLHRKGYRPAIINGYAQAIPFPENSFESVAATFPAEYLFDSQMLLETWRVLKPGGRLVLLPVAWITGKSRLDRLAAWLFKVTKEAGAIEAVLPALYEHIQAAGFEVQHELVELEGSRVLVIVARK